MRVVNCVGLEFIAPEYPDSFYSIVAVFNRDPKNVHTAIEIIRQELGNDYMSIFCENGFTGIGLDKICDDKYILVVVYNKDIHEPFTDRFLDREVAYHQAYIQYSMMQSVVKSYMPN